MAREEGEAFLLRQLRSDTGIQNRTFDQPGDMLVVQTCVEGALAITRGADEDRTEVDLRKVQPLLQCMHGAGLILGAASDLDFAPSGLCVEGQEGAFLENLDPAAGIRRIVFVHVQGDDF